MPACIEAPLTKMEISQWLWSLGKTKIERLDVLVDLILHSRNDHMSAEDRVICLQTLEVLRAGMSDADWLMPLPDINERGKLVVRDRAKDDDEVDDADHCHE